MKTKVNILLLTLLLVVSCGRNKEYDAANRLLSDAKTAIADERYNLARLQLDSLDNQYPREVDLRREAKHLQDTITYLEACRTIAYSDSLLQALLPKADALLPLFRHEKKDQYEDHGRYIHPLLVTDKNMSRSMLQAVVTEDLKVTMKSFYYGSKKIDQSTLTLSCGDDELTKSAQNHAFNTEGWHEIMTFEGDDALQLLNFISANKGERLKVQLMGQSTYIYYLQQNEKEALEKTYELYLTLSDIRRLEQSMDLSHRQIELLTKRFSKKY